MKNFSRAIIEHKKGKNKQKRLSALDIEERIEIMGNTDQIELSCCQLHPHEPEFSKSQVLLEVSDDGLDG